MTAPQSNQAQAALLARLAAAAAAAPTSIDAQADWGEALLKAGQPKAAAAAFARAIALKPASPDLLCFLGNAQRQAGDTEGAVASYRLALTRDARNLPAQYNLVMILLNLGRLAEATDAASHLAAIAPNSADVLYAVGITHHASGRYHEAIASLKRVVAMAPRMAVAWEVLGAAHCLVDDHDEGESAFREALNIDPNRQDSLMKLAEIRLRRWDLPEAQALYRRTIAVKPTTGARFKQALCLPGIFADDHHLETERAALLGRIQDLTGQNLRITEPLIEAAPNLAVLPYHGLNDRAIMEAIATFLREACPSLTWTAAHCRPDSPRPTGRRIRIGFASRFFYDHTIGRLIQPWIAGLDRTQFHVSLWGWGKEDAFTDRIKANIDHAGRLSGSFTQMRTQLAEAELDVLIYPEIGFDPIAYFLAYARLAPIQAAAWGQPGTTGIPTLDYFLSETDMEPDDADSHYTERLITLNGMASYGDHAIRSARTPDRPAFGFENDWHLYGCLQTLYKFQPGFDPLIAEILRHDPQGRMIVTSSYVAWGDQWLDRFGSAHPDVASRVLTLPDMDWERFCTLTATLDVTLDSPAFSGGRTTYDTLLLGTPTVTLPGPMMRARQTKAYLQKIGLPETIAADAESYVTLANRIAMDSDWRRTLSTRITEAAPSLRDARPLSASFQSFVLQAVEKGVG